MRISTPQRDQISCGPGERLAPAYHARDTQTPDVAALWDIPRARQDLPNCDAAARLVYLRCIQGNHVDDCVLSLFKIDASKEKDTSHSIATQS